MLDLWRGTGTQSQLWDFTRSSQRYQRDWRGSWEKSTLQWRSDGTGISRTLVNAIIASVRAPTACLRYRTASKAGKGLLIEQA